VVINLAVTAVVLYSGAKIFQRVTSSEKFSLSKVEVIGAERASAEKIRQALAPYIGHNLLELNLNEIAAISSRDPWVRGSSVKRVLPDTLHVQLNERRPAALAVIDGVAHLVDSTGYVIGDTGPGRSDDLPVLTGLGQFSDGELAAGLRRGVRAVQRLKRSAPIFLAGISELDVSDKDRLTVRTILPGPDLLLDPGNVERNVVRYLELSEVFSGRFGDATYLDLRWRGRIAIGPPRGDQS
jgi:cell division protein FtsQ